MNSLSKFSSYPLSDSANRKLIIAKRDARGAGTCDCSSCFTEIQIKGKNVEYIQFPPPNPKPNNLQSPPSTTSKILPLIFLKTTLRSRPHLTTLLDNDEASNKTPQNNRNEKPAPQVSGGRDCTGYPRAVLLGDRASGHYTECDSGFLCSSASCSTAYG
ncbi:hypothetical protein L2E82_13831 [Cichorium intybus]|uniref:Uncharacterized protein n=1 Tax=Cichorium intybus TaxID=13427 RepID=A0ACB9EY98_CICIN|nr:hypothetical protein L1887_33472 [Cichorium endivia]KAI3763834.1 hypothetical protein L2E82_13831 [Cichorium intybus]